MLEESTIPKKMATGTFTHNYWRVKTLEIEDITRWRKDMNFIFEWQKQYLTHSRRSFVEYCFCHEKKAAV